MPVTVVDARKGRLAEEIPLSGTIIPVRISLISAKESGIVESLHFDEGDSVNKGDTFATIDSRLAEIELARIRAQFNEAKARLKEAERQRDEAAKLVQKKHIPETSYESRIAEVDINNAIVQRLQADISRQQEVINRHTVYAPFDGVVTNKLIEVGQWINTDDPLYELTELNPVRIEVPVPQYYYGQIRVGTPVRIIFDAVPDQSIDAKITSMVPLGRENTRTFPVLIDIDNEKRIYAPGMSARVHLQLDNSNTSEVLLIPRDAVVRHPGGLQTVWVMREQNGQHRAAPISVNTGRSNQGWVEIIDGNLKAGDKVIIRGNEILQPGQLVYSSKEQDPAL